MKKSILLLLWLLLSPLTAFADNEQTLEALQEYLDFTEYASGTISVEQLNELVDSEIVYIDTRNAGQFTRGHIPGAINIEWREVLKRRNEIPRDKPVVMYCETGLLSSKAQLMLRMDGYENIKVLWGGYLVWVTRQSFQEAVKIRNIPPQKH